MRRRIGSDYYNCECSIYFVTGNWNVDDTQHRLVQAAKVIKYSCAQRVTDDDDGGDLVAQKRSSTSSGGG